MRDSKPIPVSRRLLTREGLEEKLGHRIAESTLRDWALKFGFPLALDLGGNRVGTRRWLEREVDAWIDSRPRRELGKGQYQYVGRVDAAGKPRPHRRGNPALPRPRKDADTSSVVR